jgi:hypothetical protein
VSIHLSKKVSASQIEGREKSLISRECPSFPEIGKRVAFDGWNLGVLFKKVSECHLIDSNLFLCFVYIDTLYI